MTETGDDTAPMCLKHREPYPGQLTDEILNQLTIVAKSIRKMSPDTEIVLSYIPTSSGIYGDSMTDCPDRQNDITLQEENSQILEAYAAEQDIHYVDVTPGLREAAETEIVWSPIDHFSPLGYQIYASLLAEAIEPLLKGK